MDIRLLFMVGAAALIVAGIAFLRWHDQIDAWIMRALGWIYRFLKDPKTCKVAETFCVEVAVLWFVFPLLDLIYEHWENVDNGPNRPALPSLHQAYLVAGLFFLFAVVLSHIGGKAED